MWGEMVLGMAEMSQCGAGRCSVQPEPVCIPSCRKEPGKARGERLDPNSSCPAVPSPRASPKPGFGGMRSKARSRAGTGRARGQSWLMRHRPGKADKFTGNVECAPLGGRPAGGRVSGRGWEGEEPLVKGQRCPPRGRGGRGADAFPHGGLLMAAALTGPAGPGDELRNQRPSPFFSRQNRREINKRELNKPTENRERALPHRASS